jgi:CRISPR-associated protein Cas2
MTLLTIYDFPRDDAAMRKQATKYQQWLEKIGFHRLQFSVYYRKLLRARDRDLVLERIRAKKPDAGNLLVFTLSDADFENRENLYGSKVLYEEVVDRLNLVTL